MSCNLNFSIFSTTLMFWKNNIHKTHKNICNGMYIFPLVLGSNMLGTHWSLPIEFFLCTRQSARYILYPCPPEILPIVGKINKQTEPKKIWKNSGFGDKRTGFISLSTSSHQCRLFQFAQNRESCRDTGLQF